MGGKMNDLETINNAKPLKNPVEIDVTQLLKKQQQQLGKGIRHYSALRLMANGFKFLLHFKEFEIGCNLYTK